MKEAKREDAFGAASLTRPVAGQPFTIEGLALPMLWVPPGSFFMGMEDGDPDEHPVTHVTLSQGYWLGSTEVTQAQWGMIMHEDPSYFRHAPNPVDGVSWREARQFCETLNVLARENGFLPRGYSFRLPTEAQWEYACRPCVEGGPASSLDLDCWHLCNSGNVTHAVGLKRPNAWGFHDLLGNVWEWCEDWYVPSLPGGEVTDPHGPRSGTGKVYRGGGWFSVPVGCRRSNRASASPDYRYSDLGFRLALTPD